MSTLIFAPYGTHSPEVGLVVLYARYLKARGGTATILRCNGAVSMCERDSSDAWRREASQCFGCMQEAKSYHEWSAANLKNITPYIHADDIHSISRLVSGADLTSLGELQINRVKLSSIVRGSFSDRFKVDSPDPNNKLHDRYYRAIVGASLQLVKGVDRAIDDLKPTRAMFVFGTDFLTRLFCAVAVGKGLEALMIEGNLSQRCIRIFNLKTESVHDCPLLIEDVLALRNDVSTWSPELLHLLDEIQAFIDGPEIAEAVPAV